jgi:hypothetical protein
MRKRGSWRRWYRKARKQDKRQGRYALLVKRYGPFRDAEHAYEVLRKVAWREYNGYWKVKAGLVTPEWLHRAVMMVKLGRALRRGEQVHHQDGNRANNHPYNLKVCADPQEHAEAHGRGVGTCRTSWGTVAYTTGPNAKRVVARVVMELALGRKLRRDERVWHRNGRAGDNRAANLEVISLAEHWRRCQEMGRRARWARRRESGSR